MEWFYNDYTIKSHSLKRGGSDQLKAGENGAGGGSDTCFLTHNTTIKKEDSKVI